MSEQELVSLITVYQRKLNDANAQAIAFEARTIVQQDIINSLQNQLETQNSNEKSSVKRVNTKPDGGNFQ
jgi:hypothetical protein